jgi:hypothetical protein
MKFVFLAKPLSSNGDDRLVAITEGNTCCSCGAIADCLTTRGDSDASSVHICKKCLESKILKEWRVI